jgi:hypothetical protein
VRGWTAAALVLLGATSCSGGDGTAQGTPPVPTPLVTTGAPRPAPVTTTTRPAASAPAPASAVPAQGSRDFGYFTAVVSSGAPVRLWFDRAQFLTGAQADEAASAHGDETPVPNGYYIVNDNTLRRTLRIAADVEVFGSQGLNGYAGDSSVEAEPRTLGELLGFLGSAQGRQTGFNLVYGAGGVVSRVAEQYQP